MSVRFTGFGGMDYSSLFSSLSSNNKSTLSSLTGSFSLADYASIKNGSYRKALKAYYTKVLGEEKKTSSSAKKTTSTSKKASNISTEYTSALAKADGNAEQLVTSVSALNKTGSKSVFEKKDITTKNADGTTTTTKDYDRDAIYNSIKTFTDNYNSLIKSGQNTGSFNVQRQTNNLASYTSVNKSKLEEVGITVNEDKTLSIDKDKMNAADVDNLKSLFHGSGSYASTISSRASTLEKMAENEIRRAGTYNSLGNYSSSGYSRGDVWSSYI